MAVPDPSPTPSATATAATTPATPGFVRRNWGKLTLLTLVGLPLVGITAWSMMALGYTYSTGTRTGYVQKLSLKGWVCKTWEGELALVTMPGAIPEKFLFSIRSDAVAAQLNKSLGKRVGLRYTQHLGLPTSCFGETEYFVNEAVVVE